MRQFLIGFVLFATHACGQSTENGEKYPRHVGDIAVDPKLDDPAFKPCDETAVAQYYNFGKGLQYKGEKPKINTHFKEALTNNEEGESGFLTIRFIVNCEGKTGRFRVQGMDNEFRDKKFKTSVTNRLLDLTKQLDGWVVGEHDGKSYDYYQYLTFKIENGKLVEIMP